jgi:TonB family protein
MAALLACGADAAPQVAVPKVDAVVTELDGGMDDASGPTIGNRAAMSRVLRQARLDDAAVPFAMYVNGMHRRIHSLFTDEFMASLDGLPPTDPLNVPTLMTNLEITVNRDGTLSKIRILKSSGIAAFDNAAVDSVSRAQPFGNAPASIVSDDGFVHMHWRFQRDPTIGCSPMNTRPILLRYKIDPMDGGVLTL